MKNNSCFSILELILIVVILSIICTYSFINYNKVTERSYERDAINNLALVREARKLYVAQHGTEIPLPLNNAAAINAALNTAISSDKLTFKCESGIDDYAFCCEADSPSGWNLHFGGYSDTFVPTEPRWEGLIHCAQDKNGAPYGGPCPSCVNSLTGCPTPN